MSRKRKALVREYHAGLDDWHLFMEDAKDMKDRDEVASTRRSMRKARRELINLKKHGVIIIEAECFGKEVFWA